MSRSLDRRSGPWWRCPFVRSPAGVVIIEPTHAGEQGEPPISAALLAVTSQSDAVVVSGDLDAFTAPVFVRALLPLIERGGVVRVDARQVDFCGRAGVQALNDAAHRLDARGRLVVLDPPTAVRRAFDVFDLHGAVDIVPSGRCTGRRTG